MATSASVAPDFDVRSHVNTLRVKPEYRITLRVGEIEDLFKHGPGTREGRRERLQILGLFYFPLSHAKADARYEKTWAWVKERLFGVSSDPEADAILKKAVKCRVLGGAKPAGWSDAPAELPPDAADPAKPEASNFAKIRVPGGYACNYSADGGIDINLDPNCPAEFITNSLFEHEAQFYRDNPVLGTIPLVASVERRPPGGGDWAKAEGVDVHFQLVPAYADLPAYDPAAPASEQFNRPPLRSTDQGCPESGGGKGAQKRYDAEEGHALDPADPRGRNCHDAYGGKRGKGIDEIFSVAKTPGFHEPHGGRALPHAPYEKAETATAVGDAHKHAVKTKTNADGEAGVLFMPSRMGGDRYRIRAYLPVTGDGERAGSVAATTGTFVVWRNIRISRILRHEVGPAPDPRLLAQAVPHKIRTAEAYLKIAGAHDGASTFYGLDTINLGVADGTTSGRAFDPMPRQFARAFCELELDPNAVETLSAADYEEAWRLGAEDAAANLNRAKHKRAFDKIQDIDVEALYCRDLTFASPETTVCALPMRSPLEYNATVPAKRALVKGMIADQVKQIVSLTENFALNGFLRSLSWNGALPGLTLVYGALGYTWQLLLGNHCSGLMENFRGAFLWYGAEGYGRLVYDCASNSCHELGHALFMPHGPNVGSSLPEKKAHDDLGDCVCVMSYELCAGLYCGKSLMSLRGWNIANMT